MRILLSILLGVSSITVVAAQDSELSKDQVALAHQILADPDLPAVLDKARELLKTGLNAGGGYGEVWIRDLNTFLEISLEVNDPDRLRESLLVFLYFQGQDGNIVDGYVPAAKGFEGYKFRTSPLAPDLKAHKNTVETDQESSLVPEAPGRLVAFELGAEFSF